MGLKLLRSTLGLLLMSTLLTDGAIAQPVNTLGEVELRSKIADDYNAGKFGDVIADADALQKLDALDSETALVTAKAYYKTADYPGCVKYVQQHFGASPNKTSVALLKRCSELSN
jgi:outer membrane protein assembly factor BamD (BamD/ComL family)